MTRSFSICVLEVVVADDSLPFFLFSRVWFATVVEPVSVVSTFSINIASAPFYTASCTSFCCIES
jgi:hypothetical protein